MHLLLNRYAKILYSDNGVFTDFSDSLRRWTADLLEKNFTKNEDYLYIGLPHSFASRFILMDGNNVNEVVSQMQIDYYYGDNNWRSVKNISDETSIGGAMLAKTGFISWDLPDDWIRCQINNQPELPYNTTVNDGNGFFWIRISASETLTVGMAIKWLGVIWTNQEFLLSRWSEVLSDDYLPTGKTDWYEMIELSTRDVADDLNIQNVIDYELQAKDISEMANLTALKTLVNILLPFRSSEALTEMRKDFKAQYGKALAVRLKCIDTNKDEKITEKESVPMNNTRILRT